MLNETALWTSFKTTMRRYVARNRRKFVIRKVAQYCRTYLDYYENHDYDIALNGERFVLEALRDVPMRTIFDVGANTGDWAIAAAAVFPEATIHAFEIVPATSETLRSRAAGNARIVVNAFGLSDSNGTVDVRSYEGRSDLATVFRYSDQRELSVTPCPVKRGDDYLASHGLSKIDFLKIDVEGGERTVLDGFAAALASRAVSIIQFEYGQVNIVAGVLLRDLWSMLSSHGYVVGKIFPTYVDFRAYSLADEDFRGPNFLAVLADREDLVARLRTLNGNGSLR